MPALLIKHIAVIMVNAIRRYVLFFCEAVIFDPKQ